MPSVYGTAPYNVVQLGREATPGTAVPATTIWRGPFGAPEDTRIRKIKEESVGALIPAELSYDTRLGAKLAMPATELTYEQAPHIFEAGILTATPSGAGPYVRLYDFPLTTARMPKFYTLEAGALPGGRGHGEPIRLMVDIEQNHDFVEAFVHQADRKLLVSSSSGYGFVVPESEVVAATRKGKQVLNVSEPDEARLVVPVDGDHVAVVGENRKMLVFRLSELNEMTRGKGVILFRSKDSGVSDVRVFAKSAGLTWLDSAGRTFTLEWRDLKEWVGLRAQAGHTVPRGFPKSNRFGPAFG